MNVYLLFHSYKDNIIDNIAVTLHSKDCFPFNMMSGGTTDEQQLYRRIKDILITIHRAPNRKKNTDQLLKLINEWYNIQNLSNLH